MKEMERISNLEGLADHPNPHKGCFSKIQTPSRLCSPQSQVYATHKGIAVATRICNGAATLNMQHRAKKSGEHLVNLWTWTWATRCGRRMWKGPAVSGGESSKNQIKTRAGKHEISKEISPRMWHATRCIFSVSLLFFCVQFFFVLDFVVVVVVVWRGGGGATGGAPGGGERPKPKAQQGEASQRSRSEIATTRRWRKKK